MVEKKPITELELIDRYQIHKKTNPHYQSDYQSARPDLIQELCLEKMNDLLWERLTSNNVELSDEQLQAFKKNYRLEELKNTTVRSFYAGLVKKERLARHLIQDKIQLSDYELSHFMHQPQAWQQLGALWSFKMAYSDQPLTNLEAESQARTFKDYPAGKINKGLHELLDWTKIGSWQFFKQDDEYIGLFIDSISLPLLLDSTYTINLLNLNTDQAPKHELLESIFIGKQMPPADSSLIQLSIHSSTDLPATMIEELATLNVDEITSPVMIGGRWYAAQLVKKEKQSISNLQEHVTALLKQQLLDKKTEEKLPMWYDSLKKDYFIKVLV
jgi:hypothetical protein